jgi:hypothetical protein
MQARSQLRYRPTVYLVANHIVIGRNALIWQEFLIALHRLLGFNFRSGRDKRPGAIIAIGGIMSKLILLLIVLFSGFAQAKELTNRLGVGFRNTYAFEMPAAAVSYYPNADYGVIGALGLDTQNEYSKFGLTGGLRRFIFREENMNFFMGGTASMVSQELAGETSSGFELAAIVGSEFFLSGLDSLGFNIETGIGVTNVKKVRFRTFGDSFLRAGIFFYF